MGAKSPELGARIDAPPLQDSPSPTAAACAKGSAAAEGAPSAAVAAAREDAHTRPASPGSAGSSRLPISIGKIALILVVLQTTAHVLTLRYTRMPGRKRYHASTAVLLMEATKMSVCLGVVAFQEKAPLSTLWNKVVVDWPTTMKVAVPACLYVVQNNLLFVAATELDAPVFQVLYQFKLLTTALFTIFILGRSITPTQWAALGLLTLGVSVVQLSSQPGADASVEELGAVHKTSTTGLAAVFAACVLSGFCGVWFERMLKLRGASEASLWVRNIQLALVGFPVAAVNVVAKDGAAVALDGFLAGYTPAVVATVLLGSAGGLIVAVAMKYADNILKGFATSVSVVLSTLVSTQIKEFDFHPQPTFFAGAALVLAAVYVYGTAAKGAASGAPTSRATKGALPR